MIFKGIRRKTIVKNELPKNGIKKILLENSTINKEYAISNMRRLCYLVLIAAPASLINVIKFLFFIDVESKEEILWRTGIIIAHSSIVVTASIFGIISFYMLKKEKLNIFSAIIIKLIAIAFILIVGALIVMLDQLVTTSITPFLIACTVPALVFIIRPTVSIPIYLVAYIIYDFLLSLTQRNKVVLASNQVNGITITAIGICLSIILWKNNKNNLIQRKYIEHQKKKLEELNAELEVKNKRLEYLAACDSMTGLLNRREFERIVNHELSRMRRYEYNSCIIIVDIDFFKKINDEYGHPAGDELIKQFSFILKNELREFDIIGRWGGEEFIILLPDVSIYNGRKVAERLRQVIENNEFIISDNVVKITASFGVAELSYNEPEAFKKSYDRADKALYIAKKSGRNCVS